MSKIREIATQASNWCIENAVGTPVAWEWEDKFGELLVKECLSYMQDGDIDFAKFMIKKNFGVEE